MKLLATVLTLLVLFTATATAQTWDPELQLKLKAVGAPQVSPDGKRVVYIVNEAVMTADKSEFVSQIWLANIDTKQNTQLTFGEKSSTNPKWSPDGNWIAYVSIPADTGCSGVRLMQPDGSVDHPVAEPRTGPNGTCHDAAIAPSFSPNSKRVLYVATGIRTPHKTNGTDLYTVSIHGGAHRRLTRDDRVEASPVFSPDGKRVAYEATGGRGRHNGVFTISASGGHRHRISPPHGGLSWQPRPAG